MATRLATQWLAHRRDREASSLDLSELVALTFRDRHVRRNVELQLESVAADMAERIERLLSLT